MFKRLMDSTKDFFKDKRRKRNMRALRNMSTKIITVAYENVLNSVERRKRTGGTNVSPAQVRC